MNGFLLDTNICIYYIKGLYKLDQKFDQISNDALFISEITLAELKFGAENSNQPERNRIVLADFFQESKSSLFLMPWMYLHKRKAD